MAHLLKYDSAHGIFGADVQHDEKNLIVNGKKIPVSKTS
jgi:glyceraldehyde 3-phosphate dehydrogenase